MMMSTMYRKKKSDHSSGQPERSAHVVCMLPEQEQNERQVEKPKTSSPPQKDHAARKNQVSEKGEKIKKDLDKIMDEIDEVLEENAEEFIKSYVQRGGE